MVVIWVIKIFYVQLFCVSIPSLLHLFCFYYVFTISVFYCADLWMKCSFDLSSFLEEISIHFPSVVFLYFFVVLIEEGLLVSPCYSLELCIKL